MTVRTVFSIRVGGYPSSDGQLLIEAWERAE